MADISIFYDKYPKISKACRMMILFPKQELSVSMYSIYL